MDSLSWNRIVQDLRSHDLDTCVTAAERLHKESTEADLGRLVSLLDDPSFFVRESAAWPLAELAGYRFLEPLFVAYQRGFDEGHDNDGFSAALIEAATLFPSETHAALTGMLSSAKEPVRGHIEWLLTFAPAWVPNYAF